MIVYELSHLFYRIDGSTIYSPKCLGVYASYEAARKEIAYFSTQPGFRDNTDAFSVRAVPVMGAVEQDIMFEALMYLHTEDYEFEANIDLGLYGDEQAAHEALQQYCLQNKQLLHTQGLVCEEIKNKCFLGKREWAEGFTIESSMNL